MNKKITLLLFIGLTLSYHSSLAQATQHFIFNGKIEGLDSSTVYLEYRNNENQFIIDSCRLHSGKFKFTGMISQPTIAYLQTMKNIHRVNNPHLVTFYLEATKMKGYFDAENLKTGRITGSKTQDENSLLNKQLEGTTMRNRSYDIMKDFILNHPDSYVSVYLLGMLSGEHLSDDSVAFLYSRMPLIIQQSRYGHYISKQLVQRQQLKPGHAAPNFIQPDQSGRLISLENLRGQYILLDFWASWCAPCRKEIRYLKEIKLANENNNLAIVSISLDTDRNKWLKAIKEEHLDWLQLSDLKGVDNSAARVYNSIAIPSYFLIDPKGMIRIANERGKQLVVSVNEILNENK